MPMETALSTTATTYSVLRTCILKVSGTYVPAAAIVFVGIQGRNRTAVERLSRYAVACT